MQTRKLDRHEAPSVQISSSHEFREALSRIRILEGSARDSEERREREALELAVSRYLLFANRNSVDQP